MARYAESTNVSTDTSRMEIERTLMRYGSPTDGFAYGRKGNYAYIEFEFEGKRYRLILPLPDPGEKRFWQTPGRGLERTPDQAQREWEQACRQSWRALALVIKAKLEAVEAGITTAADEFLAHRVLPTGRTVSEEIGPKLLNLKINDVPALLPRYEG